MGELITIFIVGVFLIVLGVLNTKGNLRSIHSYHWKRVAPEDIKPYGRLVGTGSIIIGAAMLVFGALSFAHEKTQVLPFDIIGAAILIASVVIGLVMIFYAMIKYNKGIF